MTNGGGQRSKYAINSAVEQPNCVVGQALVVHFSYYTTRKEMLRLNLLEEFEVVLKKEVGTRMEQVLWNALGFGKRFGRHG